MMTRSAAALFAGCLMLAGCKAAPEEAVATDGTAAAPVAAGTSGASGFAAGKWTMTAEITDVQATGATAADEAQMVELRQALTGKPSTQEVCVSQADVDGGLEKLFVTPGAQCDTDQKQIANGTIQAAYSCQTQSGSTAKIQTAGGYTADTLTTTTQIRTPGPTPGTALTMSAKTTGQRVGDC